MARQNHDPPDWIQIVSAALIGLFVTAAAALAALAWWLRVRSRRDVRRREPRETDTDEQTGAVAELPPDVEGRVSAPEPEPSDDPGALATEEAPAFPGHDLRFTVYRPGVATPGRWYDLLVFMHEFVHPSERLATELDPEARIEREVRRILGEDAPPYVAATEDAAATVPREGVLTFDIELQGFRVNPPRQTVAWHEDLQRVSFRIQAEPGLAGRTARGRLTVFHGPLILAEMALVIPVGQGEDAPVQEALRPYRRIFASYAREDGEVVRRLGAFAASVGDRYLRDVTALRTGEEWNPGLAGLIERADIFQLFWSWNAMESEWVRREWTHALNLGRADFIRPVYWEDPLPSRPEQGLPPPELSELHFHRLPGDLVGTPAGAGRPGVDAGASPGRSTREAPPPPPPSPGSDERLGPSEYTRIIRASEPSSTSEPSPTSASSPASEPGPTSELPGATGRRRTSSRLPWALPAVAVAVLALGTSTLMMMDRPPSTYPSGVRSEAPAETGGGAGGGGASDEPPMIDVPPLERPLPSGVIVADVSLEDVPLGGVTVRLESAVGVLAEATTAEDGRVAFRGVPLDTVRLVVAGAPEGARLVGGPPRIVVRAGDTVRAALRLEGGGRLPPSDDGSTTTAPPASAVHSEPPDGKIVDGAQPATEDFEIAADPPTRGPVLAVSGPDRPPPPGRAGR